MRLSKSWMIATKDFKIFSKKRYVIYSLVAVPLIVGSLLPLVVYYAEYGKGGTRLAPGRLSILLPAFLSFYLIPRRSGSERHRVLHHSGRKGREELGAALGHPNDGWRGRLLGKGIAAFLPPIGSVWAAWPFYY